MIEAYLDMIDEAPTLALSVKAQRHMKGIVVVNEQSLGTGVRVVFSHQPRGVFVKDFGVAGLSWLDVPEEVAR